MKIYVNTLVRKLETGEVERVLYIDLYEKNIILININDRNWSYVEDYNIFINSFERDKRKIIEDIDSCNIVSEIDLTEVEKEKRDKAYKIVMEFYKYAQEPDIFNKKIRNMNMDKICKKFKVSRSTVEVYLKRYWKRGMSKNALLPDYFLCGGRGKEKATSNLKRGRPSKYSKEGINIDEGIKKIFKASINKFYYSYAQNTFKTAYKLMINEYFTYKRVNNDGKEEIVVKDKIPTLSQFRYWFNKSRDIKREVSSRFGGRVYQQKNRSLLGTVRDNIVGPGYRYQVDSTVADIYLLSEFDNKIIGRPNIVLVVDTFSYAIVGVNVTLDNPSWQTAAIALINAMSDKVEYCKEFGIEITEEQWEMKHIPYEILADRGSEWLSGHSDTLVNIGINVSNTSSYRAELKSQVEQSFRLLNLKSKSLVPGTINQDFQQRGAKNYILDAKLNLKDFTKIIIKCILNHNSKVLTNYSKDVEMLKVELKPTPKELWNWGIKNITGELKTINKQELELALLPRGSATVTERGIRFRGIYYSSIKAIEERWFEIARSKGKYKITVAYSPNNINNIYIINRDRSYERCFILNKDSKYRDKSLADIEYIKEKEKEQLKDLKSKDLQRDIELINDINAIVQEAKNRIEGIEFKGKDIKGIRKNRALEKELLNKEDKSTEFEFEFEFRNQETVEESSDLELIKSLTRRRGRSEY